MDVTSLLNSSSVGSSKEKTCSDQTPTSSTTEDTTSPPQAPTPTSEDVLFRRSGEYKVTGRSRTPWDAGGYSLPLLETKMSRIPVRSAESNSSTSPTSPKHKSSNSSSSLSSYAASLSSISHSRISSRSTVNGCPGVTSAVSDVLPVEFGLESKDQLSPADLSKCSKDDDRDMLPNKRGGGLSNTGLGRPRSPSDAILISRPRQNSGRKGLYDTTMPGIFESSPDYIIPPLNKLHKRIASAPNFIAVSSIDRTFPPLPTSLQLTPPPSHQGDRRSSYVMEASSSSPTGNGSPAQQEIKCMYAANCDTGSQLRKAISHIFGRNKLCTRMIPQHVWVHYCRKHYQRSRYRNAHEYAKLQCELVQDQVRRVHSWSEENRKSGQGGVVVDWSLSMRKREQNRVQENSHKKRPSGQDSDKEDTVDRAVLNGTAVPDWLREKVGDGYSTSEISQIVERLQKQVEVEEMSQMPDIEILPNITDVQESSRSKASLKRKASTSSTHRRSQSVGDALHSESQPLARRIPRQPVTRRIPQPNGDEEALQSSPLAKRRRIDDDVPRLAGRSGFTVPQVPERIRSPTPIQQLSPLRQRSSSEVNRDNRLNTYSGMDGRDHHHPSGSLLPSPISQRAPYNFPTMSHGLESYPVSQNYSDIRRPPHVRSRSDVYRAPHYYPSYPSYPEYQSYHQSYDTSPSTYERSYMAPNNFSTPSTDHSSHLGYYTQYPSSIPPIRSYDTQSFWGSSVPGHSASNALRHGRHQSSPSLQHQMPHPPAPEYDVVSSSRPAGSYEHPRSAGIYEHHSYSRRQDSFTSSHRQYNYRPVVEEEEKAKAIYSERR